MWLETRAKKVERANRRKAIRLAEEKAQILDKHQKLDALAKQQKEFDKKRKVRILFASPGEFDFFVSESTKSCRRCRRASPFATVQNLAQDAYVAKLKLRHEQERQMEMLKRGKKPDTSALTSDDGVVKVRSNPNQFVATVRLTCSWRHTRRTTRCLHKRGMSVRRWTRYTRTT